VKTQQRDITHKGVVNCCVLLMPNENCMSTVFSQNFTPTKISCYTVAALTLHTLLSTDGVLGVNILCNSPVWPDTIPYWEVGLSNGHRPGCQSWNPVMMLSKTITKDLPCCTGAFNLYCVQAHGPRQISLQVHSHPNVTLITYFRQHVTEHCTVIVTHSMVQATTTALQPCSRPLP